MSHSFSNTLSKLLLVSCLALLPIALQAQESPAADFDTASADSAVPELPAAKGTVVYKSVDKDGKTVFTDTQPTDRPSDAVTVLPANSISLPSGGNSEAREKKLKNKYNSVTITEPQNDAYFGQEVQAVTVKASTQPFLRGGDRIQFFYDGNPLEGQHRMVTLTNLERGTHIVIAKVLDTSGKVLIESEPVQFHVRRTSVLNQHKPQPVGANNSPSGGTGGTNTTAAPPPAGGFGSAQGFGGSASAGGGKAAGGAGGAGGGKAAGGAGGAAPRPGR